MPQCDKVRFAAAKGWRGSDSGRLGYSVAMAPENDDQSADFDRLARRYLDLWQSQLAGLAADPGLSEQMARLFAAANAQVAAALKAAQPEGAPHGTSSAPGTTPPAAPPGNGADDVGELRKRVATLEARIRELEAQLDARPDIKPDAQPGTNSGDS
jgi:hypothetical protein